MTGSGGKAEALSRRQVMRTAAFAGGAVWAVPAVQAIAMTRAHAQSTSPVPGSTQPPPPTGATTSTTTPSSTTSTPSSSTTTSSTTSSSTTTSTASGQGGTTSSTVAGQGTTTTSAQVSGGASTTSTNVPSVVSGGGLSAPGSSASGGGTAGSGSGGILPFTGGDALQLAALGGAAIASGAALARARRTSRPGFDNDEHATPRQPGSDVPDA